MTRARAARDLPGMALEQGMAAPVAGVDEVGRGPWAGPLVAAAVSLDGCALPEGVDDSKRLPAARREALAALLEAEAAVGIGIVAVAEIDALGLTAANDLAMVRAVAAMPRRPASLLVDGRRVPPGLNLPVRAIVGGDGLAACIAAASIVAKVARDRIMVALSAEHPDYGWESNKGYGTAAHREALTRLGPSPHHRRCFRPVAGAVVEESIATR